MSRALRQHASRALHLLALLVLTLGLLAKPVLVAACELDDLDRTQASMAQDAASASEPATDPCCPGKLCGECCTPAAGMPVPALAAMMPALIADPPLPAATGVEPSPLPVDNRPPISA